jgi:cytochrome P450
MFHRFAQPMRRVLQEALREAALQGRDALEPADLLAAIRREPDTSAGQILRLRRDASDDTAAVDPAAPRANAVSAEALELFEQAYREAESLKDRSIGTDHLLLAMLKLGGPTEAARSPITYAAARKRIRRDRACGYGPDAPPDKPRGLGVALKHRVTRTVGNALKLRRIRRDLSLLHPQIHSGNPYPIYHRLRAIDPVRRDPVLGWWIVTGYAEVNQVLRDRRFSSAPRSQRTPSGTIELETLPEGPIRRQLATIATVITRQVVFLDPPSHTRVRVRLADLFTPAIMQNVRSRVQELADELIDRVAATGRMDLINDFAFPLPLTIVSEMMGMGRDNDAVLKRWSNLFGRMLAFDTPLHQDLEYREHLIEARNYFDQIIRRMQESDGPPPPLARMLSGNNAIDADELFANCGFLLAAGHETSTSVMANGMRVLIEHPRELQKLCDDPALLNNAVEELLRLESPIQWSARRAMDDVDLGGKKITKGELIFISLGAANRDPRQFPEPDTLDITRPNAAKHLAFSGGGHYCLGAALGRIELQVGYATMLRRLHDLKLLEPPDKLKWRTGTAIRTLDSLMVSYDPARAGRPQGGAAQPEPATAAAADQPLAAGA